MIYLTPKSVKDLISLHNFTPESHIKFTGNIHHEKLIRETLDY